MSEAKRSLKAISKDNFVAASSSPENIQLGCLQRIAEAAESQAESAKAMAKNINDLQYWRDYYKKNANN